MHRVTVLAYSFVPLNKSLKLLTTASLCVYPDFQDCSLMSAKFNNSNRCFLLSACLTNRFHFFAQSARDKKDFAFHCWKWKIKGYVCKSLIWMCKTEGYVKQGQIRPSCGS